MTGILWQDARYAFRVMRKSPAFSTLAIVTLALGIGVNTASVAVGYGILVRPLPYAEPSRLVIVNLLFPDGGDLGFSAPQDWLSRLRSVERAAGYYRREVTLRSAGRSTVVPAALVTDSFFDTLGTPAEFGRGLSPNDTTEVVIGRRWMNRILSGDPSQSVVRRSPSATSPTPSRGLCHPIFPFPTMRWACGCTRPKMPATRRLSRA